jgi:chorismate synthase
MNTFGHLFRITTWGESHGAGIGVVIDGCPPGLELAPEDIQAELDLRRPGQSEFTSPRKETDQVGILSGVFEGHTLGTPISLVVYNRDMRPHDYSALRDTYRPGHADFTYQKKYARRDYRGGGRSSGRETTARVAAGAVARKILWRHGIRVLAFARMIGGQWLEEEAVERLFEAGIRSKGAGAAGPARHDVHGTPDAGALDALRAGIYASQVRCPEPATAERMAAAIREAAAEKDSLGGVVEVRAFGLPAGLGDPVFAKLDALVAQGLMSLGAVKGVEFGDGFRLAGMRGSSANDRFVRDAGGTVLPGSNRAGGVAGGISTGLPLVCRAAVKPTASIGRPQSTVDALGRDQQLVIEGRHDPCIVIRLVPVVEHMVNLVLVDLLLSQTITGTIESGSE